MRLTPLPCVLLAPAHHTVWLTAVATCGNGGSSPFEGTYPSGSVYHPTTQMEYLCCSIA